MNTKWITDRLPTYAETINSCVYVWDDDHLPPLAIYHYDKIALGTPWMSIPKPAPYVKPKRWTVEYSEEVQRWYLYDTGMLSHSLTDHKIDSDGAQKIADIYNEVLP